MYKIIKILALTCFSHPCKSGVWYKKSCMDVRSESFWTWEEGDDDQGLKNFLMRGISIDLEFVIPLEPLMWSKMTVTLRSPLSDFELIRASSKLSTCKMKRWLANHDIKNWF